MNIRKELFNVLITVVASVLSALGLYIFVYPANFAPSGIDGVATMLQELTTVSAGIYTLVFNLPFLLIAWFILKKRYVIYTVMFTIISSVLIMVLQSVNFYQYVTETDRIIPAVFSGIILGIRTGLMLKIGASSGGVDVIASMIQKKFAYRNIERIISIICYVIIALSYFVYYDVNSIIFSVVQMFVFEKGAAIVMRDTRSAVEFKIITKHPNDIKDDIIYKLKHGATIIESKGMFTDEGSSIIFSVVNNRQVSEFLSIIKKYPDTFVYYSDVSGVRGNFRWMKDDIAK